MTHPDLDGQSLGASRGHDAPITDPTEDYYGGMTVAKAIHRVIRSAPVGWSTRIGLYGSWGSGKTSVLNLLEGLETAQGSIVVRFSAWSAVGEAGVLSIFCNVLSARLTEHGIKAPWLTRAKQKLAKAKPLADIGGIAGRGIELTQQIPSGTTELISSAIDFAFGWLALGNEDLKKLVTELHGRRVVVFIDDLDRADPRVIPKTLLALRELLDWPGFTFVLAFDKRVIAKALGEYSPVFGENSHVFLEKIVDLPFDLPIPNDNQKAVLAQNAFTVCCPFLPAEVILFITPHLPNEPRRVKLIARIIGVLSDVAARHDPREVNWANLALYHVIHEASPCLAGWVLNAAISKENDWTSWLGDENERQQKKLELRTHLQELATSDGITLSEIDRVVDAAEKLFKAWQYTNDAQIKYDLNLSFTEPCFTHREYRDFFEKWIAHPSAELISEAIAQGAERGSASITVAARDLVIASINNYQATLSAMADIKTSHGHAELLAKANLVLDLIDNLWQNNQKSEVSIVSRTGEITSQLLGVISAWAHWRRNPGEPELRQRERALGLHAAKECDDKAQLYCDTDPFWESHHFSDAESSAIAASWRNELRGVMIGPILNDILARFYQPEGLVTAASAEDELAAWILESPKSPLYHDPKFVDQLKTIFLSIQEEKTANLAPLAANARIYLSMLLAETRTGTWAGKTRLGELHNRWPDLIPLAWATVLRCQVPFRMRSTLMELKNALVDAGVTTESLAEADWLKLAG